MSDAVHVEDRDGVAWIALNRPEKLNAIDEGVLRGLLAAIGRIGDDPAIGAAVLHGRGRAFSAGGDVTAMSRMDEAEFSRTIDLYMQVAAAFRRSPKPVVAAVHGHALAGGFELALICDLRIAADDALFGLPDAPLGLSPTSGMTYLLPRVVGLGRAMELALRAESIDANEALRIGLVSQVVPGDTLLEAAGTLAERIAGWPRVGIAMTKSGFYGALDATFEEATAAEHAAEVRCFRDPDVAANLQRFAARKRP
jgi:2-(1,2-epoxy-1,2-dihydrophenyl)acetyl-CoA isomerase